MILRSRDILATMSAIYRLLNIQTQTIAVNQQSLEKIMAAVQVDQAALDTLAANLEAVKVSLASELAALKAAVAAAQANNTPLPAASLDGLNAALADLTALEAPAPTPAPGA
jgi:peptidoglycan hydrolase CwlO-like protein